MLSFRHVWTRLRQSTFAELLAAFAGVKRADNLADLESGSRFNARPL